MLRKTARASLSLFAALSVWLSLCCAVSAQGVPNGSAWMVPNAAPFVGFGLLAKSGAASSHTGDATETVLATVTIPANTLGANGQLKINTYWTLPNNANTKTLRVRIGGLGGSAILNTAPTTAPNIWASQILINQNATNSQLTSNFVSRGSDELVTTVQLTTAVDFTQSQSLVITGQLGTTTDTITLNGYTIEYCN